MDEWSKMSMTDKAKYISFMVQQGITDLNKIRESVNDYYSFKTQQVVDDVNNRSNADFVNRLKNPDREFIKNWENPNEIATHKMSYSEDDNGAIVYSNVQNINGKLHDFTDPQYNHGKWDALDSAIERGDTLRMSPQDAELFTTRYKQYYPQFNRYDDGGLKHPNEVALDALNQMEVPASNYLDAIDMKINPITIAKYAANKLGLPKSGLSNCILTLSQMYNPARPIATNRTIVNNPEGNGFYEIPEEYAGLGSLIIASQPDKLDNGDNTYHAMMISDYADRDYTYTYKGKDYKVKVGDPLVSYSKGKNTADSLIKNIPLSVYTDNSNGKTYNRYYNHLDENGLRNILLPELEVFPQ